MSNFKIALTAIFGISIVLGVAIFALSRGSSSGQSANLVIWGTVSEESFNTAHKNSSIFNNKSVKITYVKKEAVTFNQDFVEALALGNGPDIVLLRDDSVYKNRNKLFVIPYANYNQRDFKDRFIEGSELFLVPDGVIGLPFMVDPMVMYWNRDIFSNNLISEPPKYWDELYSLVEKTTSRDSGGNILKSAIALGEWKNITNAKEIVAMLLLQAGTPITSGDKSGVVSSVLNSQFNLPVAPSQSGINFYTQFSNPGTPAYSWNRSLPNSLNFFISGNLALYLGFGSEIFSIQQKNSNLNFDVTYMPQIRDAAKKQVFGHIYALSIVKQSRQIAAAALAVNALTESSALTAMESVTNLPPARRDLLSVKPTDPFRQIFYNSALLSHFWVDPDPVSSSNTFRDMIESITSGQSSLSQALSRANEELNNELK
ncbi:MAG: carbohydrate ABC transporter substrate-binding protein [Candidatus Zambryskibacteria bacterium]|nr:carbohydrate ABC transporter substrate-binding protein [Candidatus Zambryskibacteria bacterium]